MLAALATRHKSCGTTNLSRGPWSETVPRQCGNDHVRNQKTGDQPGPHFAS
jgi:hypothetical protein